MDEFQRLTVASMWRFEPEAVLEVGSRLKGLRGAEKIFCKYEQTSDAFTFDSRNIIQFMSPIGELITTIIDEERDNDLFEKPKITRITAAPLADDQGLESDSDDGGPRLIETSVAAEEERLVSVQSRYWQSKHGGVDCFLKLPNDVLTEVAQATGAQLAIETESKRVRVSSLNPAQVDDALERLDNLEQSSALVTATQVENTLHVDNDRDFRLQLRPYASLNSLALQRVLIDPFTPGASQFGGMYTTVIEIPDSENKCNEMPKNLAAPPRPTPLRKGGAKVWADYKFPELGDVGNLPDLPKISMAPDVQEQWFSKSEDLPTVLVGEPKLDGHRFLSREKASLVDKWVVDNVKAGAVGPSSVEPNVALDNDSSPDFISAPVLVPGIKKRVAVAAATNNQSSLNPKASTLEQSIKGILREKLPELMLRSIPSFNPAASSLHTSSPQEKPQTRSSRPESRVSPRSNMLIDTSNDVEIAVTPLSSGLMFSQAPLIPTRLAQNAPELVEPQKSVAEPDPGILRTSEKPAVTEEHMGSLNLSCAVVESNLIRPESNPSRNHAEDGDISITERIQAVSEVDTRKFHKTMRQQSAGTQSKRSQKADQKARKQAALAEAWGTPAPASDPSTTKRGTGIEPSQWKKDKIKWLKADEDGRIRNLYVALHPILAAIQGFSGTVSLEIQFGLILVHNVPKAYADKVVDGKSWDKLFRPQHGLRGPGTRFMNMITSSGADIDYILSLKDDVESHPFFSEDPSVRNISYDFHCQTKSNQSIVVSVDSSGMTVVARPETVLGAVNLHCPQRIWDFRVAVKGSQEYSREVDKETDSAIESLIDNLYVCPEKAKVLLFTQLVNPDVLRITKILMRRSTRHRCIKTEYGLETDPGQKARKDETIASLDMASTSSSDQGLYLQITEVQNLLVGQMATDKSLIRARALDPEEMVDSSRLWYEVSIVSPAIERVLESNRDLPVGGRVSDWQPPDLLGADTGIVTDFTLQNSDSTSDAKNIVGLGGLGEMYRVASRVITQLDGVGWANNGSLAETSMCLPSVAMRSNLAVALAPSAGVSEAQMIMRANTIHEIDNMDSISARNVGMGEIFW